MKTKQYKIKAIGYLKYVEQVATDWTQCIK